MNENRLPSDTADERRAATKGINTSADETSADSSSDADDESVEEFDLDDIELIESKVFG